jgi:Carboxypeptidase regulatory-like domain
MHRIALAASLVVGLAVGACGADGEAAATSGIRGQALVGPMCPVETQNSPCSDVPYHGTVVATDTGSGKEYTTESNAKGAFQLPLPPGTYEVSIVSESPPPFAKPQTVTVPADAFVQVTLSVDSGIR